MGGFSIWHLLILLVIIVVLFGGGGKLSRIMGDLGKGITSFKAGLKDDETRRRDEERERIDNARTVGGHSTDRTAERDEAKR